MRSELMELKSRLGGQASQEALEGHVEAAVLVPFIGEGDDLSLVFTRRTDDLPAHPGEISFPGGRLDPGESSLEAALREAHEELGIEPASVDVIGRLQGISTFASRYVIVPWVGILEHAEFTPNPAEIEEVIIATVDELEAGRREQRFIREGEIWANPAYDVGPNTIWGATARILTDLLEIWRSRTG